MSTLLSIFLFFHFFSLALASYWDINSYVGFYLFAYGFMEAITLLLQISHTHTHTSDIYVFNKVPCMDSSIIIL